MGFERGLGRAAAAVGTGGRGGYGDRLPAPLPCSDGARRGRARACGERCGRRAPEPQPASTGVAAREGRGGTLCRDHGRVGQRIGHGVQGFFVAAARCVGVQRARARAVAPSVPHPPQVRSSRRSAAGRASQRGAAPWADGAHVRHARRSLGRLLASALAPARVWRVPCCLHRRRWWSGVKLAGHTRHVEVRLRSQLAVRRVARVLVRGLAGRG